MVTHLRYDAMLKLLVFHATKKGDAKKHWFTFVAIWEIK